MSLLRVGLCLDLEATRQLTGQDILVFPEMVDSGYAALNGGAEPHRRGDALLQTFAELSRTVAPTCIAGSVYLNDPPPATSNTSLVFRKGRLVYRYDKIHLFRPTGDHKYFSPGKTFGVFRAESSSGRVRCGVIICYDLRFPELTRSLALQGMQVLFVPARWPAVRDEAWQSLLKARAIENQVFVVGCNAEGEEGGASYVFDPLGVMVYSSRETVPARAHAVTLDLERLAEARTLHDNLADAVVLRSFRIPASVTARRRPT
ncbi:MAG: nitrilase-related carbon-nitrogen hydrolase [Bacteroidota bacterium]